MPLKDKIAIVTGGGQEIGQEISFRLASEGAFVIIADINGKGALKTSEEIFTRYGIKSKAVKTDISQEASVIDMVNRAVDKNNTIDILVNNAAIPGPAEPIENITLEDWEQTFAVNLRGMFLCCKHVVPIMKKQSIGNIVNMASVTGKRPLPFGIPYASSKMGVIGLTRSLAAELGKWNIRVNSVCPGSVTGARQKIVFKRIMKATGKSWEQVEKEKIEASVLKTFIPPKYVAAMIAFLCSDDACMITGQDINVSAGAVMY